MTFPFEELLRSSKMHRPLFCLAHGRRRLLGSGGRLDTEDVCAHPLLGAGELVPSGAGRLDPAPEVFALGQGLTRLCGQEFTGFEVESGEVQGTLSGDGPDRAPRRVDLLQLLTPFLRQDPAGGVGGQALAAGDVVGAACVGAGVLQEDADFPPFIGGVQRCEQVPVEAGPGAGCGITGRPRPGGPRRPTAATAGYSRTLMVTASYSAGSKRQAHTTRRSEAHTTAATAPPAAASPLRTVSRPVATVLSRWRVIPGLAPCEGRRPVGACRYQRLPTARGYRLRAACR